jgi:hypothetical protein
MARVYVQGQLAVLEAAVQWLRLRCGDGETRALQAGHCVLLYPAETNGQQRVCLGLGTVAVECTPKQALSAPTPSAAATDKVSPIFSQAVPFNELLSGGALSNADILPLFDRCPDLFSSRSTTVSHVGRFRLVVELLWLREQLLKTGSSPISSFAGFINEAWTVFSDEAMDTFVADVLAAEAENKDGNGITRKMLYRSRRKLEESFEADRMRLLLQLATFYPQTNSVDEDAGDYTAQTQLLDADSTSASVWRVASRIVTAMAFEMSAAPSPSAQAIQPTAEFVSEKITVLVPRLPRPGYLKTAGNPGRTELGSLGPYSFVRWKPNTTDGFVELRVYHPCSSPPPTATHIVGFDVHASMSSRNVLTTATSLEPLSCASEVSQASQSADSESVLDYSNQENRATMCVRTCCYVPAMM